MPRALPLALALLSAHAHGAAAVTPPPAWEAQAAPVRAGLRGLSVVDARVAWASGTDGTVLRTEDGGRTWVLHKVPGAEALDLRDVDALDARTAVVTATAGRIFRTEDAGATWTLVHAEPGKDAFLDAAAFWDAQHGLVVGDPQDGRFLVLRTQDGGRTWTRPPAAARPAAKPGEAAFAASGSCLAVHAGGRAWFATGGTPPFGRARVYRSEDGGATWVPMETPFAAQRASEGLFSLAFADARHGVAVGGDYARPRGSRPTVAVTDDGGVTWTLAGRMAGVGYLSGVAARRVGRGRSWVAVGPTGAFLGNAAGTRWRRLAGPVGPDVDLNAVRFSGADGWAVGPDGRIVRFTLPAR